MEPLYIGDAFKEELDSDSYRITQAQSELEQAEQNGLRLYLSALSPADIADFYWGDHPEHDEDPVVALPADFTNKEGGGDTFYAVVKRSASKG